MEGFKKFIEDIGGVWALVLAGGSLAPVLGLFAGLAPAGRLFSEEILGTITGFLALFVLLNVWAFGKGVRKRTSKIVFAAMSFGALAIFVAYFYVLSRFQLQAPDGPFVAGCEWTPFALGEAKLEGIENPDTCPGDAGFLLEDAARPSEIWMLESINEIERQLYLLWGGLTVLWSLLVSFFALAFLKSR